MTPALADTYCGGGTKDAMTVLAHKFVPAFLAVVMFLTTAICPCALGVCADHGHAVMSCCEHRNDHGSPAGHSEKLCKEACASHVLVSARSATVDVAPTHAVLFVPSVPFNAAPDVAPMQKVVWILGPSVQSGISLLRLHCALLV